MRAPSIYERSPRSSTVTPGNLPDSFFRVPPSLLGIHRLHVGAAGVTYPPCALPIAPEAFIPSIFLHRIQPEDWFSTIFLWQSLRGSSSPVVVPPFTIYWNRYDANTPPWPRSMASFPARLWAWRGLSCARFGQRLQSLPPVCTPDNPLVRWLQCPPLRGLFPIPSSDRPGVYSCPRTDAFLPPPW